jgi:hypothetical protein
MWTAWANGKKDDFQNEEQMHAASWHHPWCTMGFHRMPLVSWSKAVIFEKIFSFSSVFANERGG